MFEVISKQFLSEEVWSTGRQCYRLFRREKQTQLFNGILFITSGEKLADPKSASTPEHYTESQQTLRKMSSPHIYPFWFMRSPWEFWETQAYSSLLLSHEKRIALGKHGPLLWIKLITHVPR